MTMMMGSRRSSSRLLLDFFLVASALFTCVDAFATPSRYGGASIVVSTKSSPPTSFHALRKNNTAQSSQRQGLLQLPPLLAKQKNGSEDRLSQQQQQQPKKERSYTKIDDGSPLGVAIVVLGGLFLLLGNDSVDASAPAGESPFWIVFVTASVAAGISRLVRNNK